MNDREIIREIEDGLTKLAEQAEQLAERARAEGAATLGARCEMIGAQTTYAIEAVPEALDMIDRAEAEAEESPPDPDAPE